jgi:hypothetical protein
VISTVYITDKQNTNLPIASLFFTPYDIGIGELQAGEERVNKAEDSSSNASYA